MMVLINYLRENEDWRERLVKQGILIKEFAIDNVPMVMLKYNLIECKFDEDVHKYCRGSIVRLDTFEYVCKAFNKFFNFGEGKCDKLGDGLTGYEKLDGSLIKFYNFNNKWRICTNGNPFPEESSLPSPNGIVNTFGDLVSHTLDSMFGHCDIEKLGLNKDRTYLFELCTPLNQVVVMHKDFKLYFLSSMDNKTGVEIGNSEEIGFPRPKEETVVDVETLVARAEELPYNDEGFVICDENFNRVKVKSPKYVAIHHMGNLHLNNKVGYKDFFHIALFGEVEEFSTYYPRFETKLRAIDKQIDEFERQLTAGYSLVDENRHLTRKEMALKINKTIFPQFLFGYMLDSKRVDIRDWIDKRRPAVKKKIIKICENLLT